MKWKADCGPRVLRRGQRRQRVAPFRFTARSICERTVRREQRCVHVPVVSAGIDRVRVSRHQLPNLDVIDVASVRRSWLRLSSRLQPSALAAPMG